MCWGQNISEVELPHVARMQINQPLVPLKRLTKLCFFELLHLQPLGLHMESKGATSKWNHLWDSQNEAVLGRKGSDVHQWPLLPPTTLTRVEPWQNIWTCKDETSDMCTSGFESSFPFVAQPPISPFFGIGRLLQSQRRGWECKGSPKR